MKYKFNIVDELVVNSDELIENYEVPECSRMCYRYDTACPNKECRSWIDYKADYNCTYVTVQNNDKMTLSDTAKRLGGLSNVRVLQIQNAAIQKVYKAFSDI